MVVAPEAIVKKILFFSSLLYPPVTFSLEFFNDNIVGCAPSAPDGSSPRGYSRIFSGIDSNTNPFTDFCRIPFANYLYPIFVEYTHLPC
jgi:hypothetical protein